MPTPHIGANPGDIAKSVIMPGDPLRAKYIAETFLKDAVEFNHVRGMLGFTGTYRGERVSVMGSGMGCPSMGIYSHELFAFYGVENIIRIGTCGTLREELHIGDLIIAMGASSNSNYACQFELPGTLSALADFSLLETAVQIARKENLKFAVGNVRSGDTFYSKNNKNEEWTKLGILGMEMESYALYLNAAALRKKALCLLTVSDEFRTGLAATADERQYSFTNMMRVALETAYEAAVSAESIGSP